MSVPDLLPINQANIGRLALDSVTSAKHGYLYVPVGKAANTNIKRWLWEVEHQRGHAHAPPEHYFGVHHRRRSSADIPPSPWTDLADGRAFLAAFGESFSFTCVRNPYSRILSGYIDKIQRNNHKDVIVQMFHVPRKGLNLAEFVQAVCAQPQTVMDQHWTPQCYATLFDFLAYDHVVRMEELAEKIPSLSERCFGEHSEFTQEARHRTDASKRMREFYDEPTREKVFTTFRRDFEAFGYGEDLDHLEPIRAVAPSGRHRELCAPLFGLVDDASALEGTPRETDLDAMQIPASSSGASYLHLYRGYLLERAGRDGSADLRRAADSAHPRDLVFLYDSSRRLWALGRKEEAVEAARRAVKAWPTSAKMHNHLGNLLTACNHLKEAERCQRTAIEMDPDNAHYHHRLAVVLQLAGKRKASRDEARHARRLSPDNPRYREHLETLG